MVTAEEVDIQAIIKASSFLHRRKVALSPEQLFRPPILDYRPERLDCARKVI